MKRQKGAIRTLCKHDWILEYEQDHESYVGYVIIRERCVLCSEINNRVVTKAELLELRIKRKKYDRGHTTISICPCCGEKIPEVQKIESTTR